MTLNGKRDNFTQDDFEACAKTASMQRGRAASIIAEVFAVMSRWKNYATEADVDGVKQDQIQNTLRLNL